MYHSSLFKCLHLRSRAAKAVHSHAEENRCNVHINLKNLADCHIFRDLYHKKSPLFRSLLKASPASLRNHGLAQHIYHLFAACGNYNPCNLWFQVQMPCRPSAIPRHPPSISHWPSGMPLKPPAIACSFDTTFLRWTKICHNLHCMFTKDSGSSNICRF